MTGTVSGPPFRVSHVVLDVDGTLVDFASGLRAGLEASVARLSELAGISITPDVLQTARQQVLADPQWHGRAYMAIRDESFRRVLADSGMPPDEAAKAAASCAATYYSARDAAVMVYPDVRGALDALSAAGFVLVAASNGNVDLGAVGLARYFAATQYAPEAGVSKPDPRFFEQAVENAGGAVEAAVAVGDRLDNDYEPAIAAGLHAVLLDRAGVTPAGGVVRIGALTELPPLLERT